jgi:hypothetical protein
LSGAHAGEVKATRWTELTGKPGTGIRLEGSPWIRIDQGNSLQALSAVAGRPSKRNRAEDPEQRLDVTPHASFVGEFRLSPAQSENAPR